MTFRTISRRGYNNLSKLNPTQALLKKLGYDVIYMLNETSGSVINNSGSQLSGLNGTLQNAPSRINGPLSGGYNFNASNHGISIADGTLKDAIESSAVRTFSILFNLRSAGPGNSGHIFSFGNADHRLFFNAGLAPRARISRGTTVANTTASTTLATGITQWLHMVYSNDLITLWRDTGTLSELAYSNQTAGAGTQNSSINALYYGNRLDLTLNTDAEIYLIADGRIALNSTQLNSIGRITPGL